MTAPEQKTKANNQSSFATANTASNFSNPPLSNPEPSLQRPPSFTSRSRSRGQPTPQIPPNGYENSSNSHLLTPPEYRRDPAADGAVNHNRWSRSTSSSRDNNSAQRSASRRMSFGAPVSFNFGSPEQDKSASKRLQKSRPSTGNSPVRQFSTTRVFESSVSQLPPILNLPSLQIPPTTSSSSSLPGSPSTAGFISAVVSSSVPDYYSKSNSTPRDFSRSRSPPRTGFESAGLSPPAAGLNGERIDQGNGTEAREISNGHSRNRSGKSSGSLRSSKQPSQKAMLSKALQKANTAVLLDNAQNFEGATQAYSEACALLQHVMLRNSGDDDRRKLEAIRNTYTSRISELKKITPSPQNMDSKALPARPESGSFVTSGSQSVSDEDGSAIIETATMTRIVNDNSYSPDEYSQSRAIPASQVPRRRESLLPSSLEAGQYRSRTPQEQPSSRSYSKSPMRDSNAGNLSLPPPMETLYMPPPLSPRRPQSPMTFEPPSNNKTNEKPQSSQLSTQLANPGFVLPVPTKGHNRVPSNESMSWLDTIDESGGSSLASSVHSRTPSMGVRRKHIRAASGGTEAEFDAALDAAVEAAYDDGFEPMNQPDRVHYDYENDDEIVANVRRRVELAKERVRQSERETAIQDALESERRRQLAQKNTPTQDFEDAYDGNDSDEEERMLEEMTRGYVLDDFEFGLQSKSALPRESDSSGFSGRTWHSSIGSNPTTAGTTLSTVTEASILPQIPSLLSKSQAPIHPPPAQALPPPPPPNGTTSQPPISMSQGVRSRRLSGQNAKQLKIETSAPAETGPLTLPPSMPPPRIPTGNDSIYPKTASLPRTRQPSQGMGTFPPPMPQSGRQASSPFPAPSPTEILSPPTPTLFKTFTNEMDSNGQVPRSGSPGRAPSRTGLKKNFSSSSLQKMKSRNLSVTNLEDGDRSPATPLSSQFSNRDANGRLPAMPTLPTPIAAAFNQKMNGAPTGGLYLFNSDITTPDSPGSPNPMGEGAPIPLEPCPTEFLLRPFWLMRALYQTIAHPKGGYLSTKLFVPRDVWRVKGVKIKNLDDKITNCDFLTAALLKLAQVDTYDADAVLEEMQALEGVLDQVQVVLAKKLGNEVGSQGSGGMFKDAPGEPEPGNISKQGSIASKPSSFSWRRLRTKNSAVGLANNYSNKPTTGESSKEGLVMATLPMTSTAVSKVRFVKRDVTQVDFSGPNANYMGALARLFDAAQALDQIARQVEDPGLRHADKTQVGLELCTRHAAEFFGFYICRFVLTDVGMLLDKFIKRGSEWVLV